MNIDSLLEELYSHSMFNIKLGLENIKNLCKYLDNPEKDYKIIHIAGTNGKGSTSTTIERGLLEAGYKVGKYTSPHILKFNERISFNGVDISDEDVAKYYNLVKDIMKQYDIRATFFEITTAMMFKYFSDLKVDYVVLETGMGGKFDATNVCQSEIAIITNVGLDHTEYLGDTIYKIAKEKAGIIKKDSYVIVGDSHPDLLKAVSEAKENFTLVPEKYKNTKYTLDFKDFVTRIDIDGKHFDFSLFGDYQFKNFLCAYEALKYLKISDEILRKAFMKVVWQCRFEIFSKNPLVIFDGAHNIDGINELTKIISKHYEKEDVAILVSILKDKDVKAMLTKLKNISSNIVITSIPDNPRGLRGEEIYNLLDNRDGFEYVDNPIEAYNYLLTKNKKINICCGSFYILIKLKEGLNEIN